MSLDLMSPEVLELIASNLDYESHLALSKVSRRYRTFEPASKMHKLRLKKLRTSIYISACVLDEAKARQFTFEHDHAVRSWHKQCGTSENVTYHRQFEFPPVSDYSFFNKTHRGFTQHIGHLEIINDFPLLIENDNVKHLITFLSDCTVDKISLVFNNNTINNIVDIHVLLARIRVKHVEFVIKNAEQRDMLIPFLNNDFPSKLASSGVREVTFSTGKAGWPASHVRCGVVPFHNGKPVHAFDVLLALFTAGIERIVVKAHSLFSSVSREAFDALLDDTAQLAKPLLLELNSLFFVEGLSKTGPYERIDDEKYGRTVKVSTTASKTPDFCYSIEYNPTQAVVLAACQETFAARPLSSLAPPPAKRRASEVIGVKVKKMKFTI